MSRVNLVIFAVLACFAAATSNADDWYTGVQAIMGSVEQASDQTIWLSNQSGIDTTVTGQSGGTCNIDQIHLIPPPGESSAWLAMVLSAISAGYSLRVYGTCDAANNSIDVSRLIVSYPTG